MEPEECDVNGVHLQAFQAPTPFAIRGPLQKIQAKPQDPFAVLNEPRTESSPFR